MEKSTRAGALIGVLALAVTTAALAAVELGFRAARPASDPGYAEWAAKAVRPLYVRAETPRGPVYRREPSLTSGHAFREFPVEKAGALRIVFLGESSGEFLGDEFARLAEGAARLQVANFAVKGSALEQVERRFQEALPYSPDVAVLLFGHNLQNPDALFTHPALAALGGWALRSRAIETLSKWLQPRLERPADDRAAQMAAMLRRMAETARERNFHLVICTVPGNLRCPPGAGPEDLYASPYLEAVHEHESGRRGAAIERLRALVAQRPAPLWRFRLADWLARAGAWEEAKPHFEAARDEDPAQLRAPSSLNGLLREAAKEPGVSLLDLERLVEAQAPHGVPGWESFSDPQHVKPFMIEREARACFEHLRRRLGPAFPPGQAAPPAPGRPRPEEPAKLLVRMRWMLRAPSPSVRAAFIDMAEANLESFRRKLDDDILGDRAEERASILACLAEAFWRSGDRAAAAALNDRALRDHPSSADALGQQGLFAFRSGRRSEALRWFNEAFLADPSRRDMAFFASKLESPS